MRRIAAAILGVGLLATSGAEARVHRGVFTIQLQRGPCLGTCPAYTVMIEATGQVVFTGGASGRGGSIRCQGEHRWTIAPAAAARLEGLIERSGFFDFHNNYNSRIMDLPTNIITVTRLGRTKTVREVDGNMVGMPAAMTKIEIAIDETAGVSSCLSRAPTA